MKLKYYHLFLSLIILLFNCQKPNQKSQINDVSSVATQEKWKQVTQTNKSSSSTSREQTITNELKYLNDIEEIGWYEVDGNTVYVGFKIRPNDISMILRGAALRGNNAINFGVHVWGVKANQKGWRPGDSPYYEVVTARYGKIK